MSAERYYDLARILDGKEKLLRYHDPDLATHMAVLGGTGMGKSFFLRQLVREHVEQGIGIAVLEPGDLCEDLLADYAKKVVDTGSKAVLKKIHCLRASPFQCFRYDAFQLRLPRNVHPELMDAVRRSWAHCKVQTLSEIFQTKGTGSSDFEGQPRVQRVLTNVLSCAAAMVDGRRLSVADARVMLDLTHRHHHDVYRGVAPQLSREIVADFETLHGFTRIQDLRLETESCLNRYRSLFSPLLSQVMSGTGAEPSVDLFDIIQKGQCLLVPLQEDRFFSHDQKVALSTVLLHDLVETLITTPRELRKPFTIVIDEAGELAVSERTARWLAILRKYGGRLVICGQDLSTFRKKEFDMAPRLLSQCGTIVCFNQKWPLDTEILARVMCSGNLDWTPLLLEVERSDGYEWLKVKETSQTVNFQKNWGKTETLQHSEQVSHQETQSHATAHGTAEQESEGRTEGGVDTLSKPKTGHDRPEQQSHADSAQVSTGASKSKSANETDTAGSSDGVTKGTTQGLANQEGRAEGVSFGESEKLVHLAKVIREQQETGKKKEALADQWEKLRAQFPCLPKRHALVKLPNESAAVEVETLEIKPPFASIEAQMRAVEWLKRELWQIHPYFFTPNLDPAEEERRIREFLGLEADQPIVIEPERNGHQNGNGHPNGNGQQNGQANGQANGKQHRDGQKKNSEKNPMT